MAIDTETKKLAVMDLDLVWEPGLPLSPGATPFSQGEQQQLLWGYPGILWSEIVVEVLIPLRRFVARKRHYRFVAIGEYAVQAFAKLPTETYHLAIDFGTRLPLSTSLSSAMLAAVDEATAVDATATVLASSTATIQGTDAVLTPQAGTAGHDYLLTLSATLNTGAVLVEQLRMQVRSTL